MKWRLKKDFAYYAKIASNKLGWVAGQVELTSQCFQHCRGCLSCQKPIGTMCVDMLMNLHRQLRLFSTFEHLTLTGGDPQAWPPLNEFLKWHITQQSKFKLQINTAMTRDVEDSNLWCTAINDIKVSMDACTEKTFRLIRGDKENTPETIIDRCWQLKHPRLAFNITVYPENMDELCKLVCWLNAQYKLGLPIRKIMITAGIGGKKGLQDEHFWEAWQNSKKCILADSNITVQTSFHEFSDEDEWLVRKICNAPETQSVRCWASLLGFHIKPNGDLYPCCIVGGEVAETLEEFKVGNISEQSLQSLHRKCEPELHYEKAVCRENCMYKQLQINTITEEASKVVLSLP